MMSALISYQANDGMWRQLVDKPEAWKESSSTAMFGYAMTVGVKQGILPAKAYARAYQKAWDALVERIDAAGRLEDVCVGTGQSQDVNYYLERPRTTGDFHGQAPLLWFAEALLGD
jgi:rhamnogalacturonyl hydrolase YesR